MYKIGFVGNSCTGKSSCAFGLLKLLKEKGALVGYITDMCRAMPFAPELLDSQPTTRLYVLFQQLAAEIAQQQRSDVDYLVTERTAMDWYQYFLWTCANTGVAAFHWPVGALVEAWLDSYALLFLMDDAGVPYVEDGYRPATTRLHDEISGFYASLFNHLEARLPGKTVRITGESYTARWGQVVHRFSGWYQEHELIRPTRTYIAHREAR